MKCPKCNRIISDNTTVCPHCHKVISLICPNCYSYSQSSICPKCGYIILEKCAKCGKLVPTTHEKCKCGFSVKSSITCNECESDEFSSLTIKFGALGAIRNLLASQDLFSKFLIKLKNLITSQLKNIDGCVIVYNNDYVVNFNKELSFTTSVNKAVRLGIKILNAFSGLNMRMQDELGTSFKLNLIIQKKSSEELLTNKSVENNVKVLMTRKEEKKYLKGMQLILDQFSRDSISMEFETDSLYIQEQEGYSIMYYELLLGNYILPPSSNNDTPVDISPRKRKIETSDSNDIYSFKVFDINAKCNFKKCFADNLISKLKPDYKILSLRGEKELQINTNSLIKFYKDNDFNVLYISCTEDMNFRPWGFFEKLFKESFGLSATNGLIPSDFNCKQFEIIKDLLFDKPTKTATSEDARFAYMEAFCNFLNTLKKTAVIVDGFENLDDTSIQTLEIFFDNYKKINTNFIFITDMETSVHSKFKGLLRTPLYTEIIMLKSNIETLLSDVKEEAGDFVQSFYYEKIKDNFNGSKLYFDNAIKYLIDKGVLANFKGKLLIKNGSSVILPKTLNGLIKNRLKALGKQQDASMILAYSVFLGERLDFATLEQLGINNINENAKILEATGLSFTNNNIIYINNYSLMRDVFSSSLKPEVKDYLAKNIIAKLGKTIDETTLSMLMGVISKYKEKYLLLWKNAKKAIAAGDFDAYLKNSLGFLSIIDKIENNIPAEEIENNKKEVYENILMSLCGYSPEKIYPIEKILFIDAVNEKNNDKIAKLSNLMLQGALITADYVNALSSLQNIFEKMPDSSLITNGVINTKILLLSLVNIEIRFNLGDFDRCIELGDELTKVITPDIIDKIKPVNFSTNLFVNHLTDTFRLVAIAKLLTMDESLDNFYDAIKNSINEDLPEKDSINAIREFLKGKNYTPSNIQNSTPFSKIIYLILQELSETKKDYKIFAQNIYQAKLLASDLHQTQLELICDLLIAYAYAKIGINKKADAIFSDILENSEKSAIFNIIVLTKYIISVIKLENGDSEDALSIINDTLDLIQKHNRTTVFYAMFEKLYINAATKCNLTIDIESEQQKLAQLSLHNELERIIKSSEFVKITKKEPKKEPPQKQEEETNLDEFKEFIENDTSTEETQ